MSAADARPVRSADDAPKPPRTTGPATASWGQLPCDASAGRSAMGRFRYDRLTDLWWWSKELFAIHGLQEGEVVPTAELLLAHKHPDDRERARTALRQALTDGEPFMLRHRIITAQGEERQVLTLAEGIVANGRVVGLRGYLTDITDAVHLEEEQGWESVAKTVEARAAIEQAKGVLMVAYGVTEEEAFALLRGYSNHTNTKLRTVAMQLMQAVQDHTHDSQPTAQVVTGILDELAPRPE